MSFHDVFDDRKPESSATELSRTTRVDTIEPLEHPRPMPLLDARAIIPNGDLDPLIEAYLKKMGAPASN